MTRYHRTDSVWPDVIIILVMVVFLFAMVQCINREDRKCSERGGTYFWHEGKCIQVKEVPR